MHSKLILLASVPMIVLAIALLAGGSPADASDEPVVAEHECALIAAFAAPEAPKKFKYAGSRKCKMCHLATHKSWGKTKMAKAFETLKPGKKVEAKKKHGLDPEKDYTRDATCLPCHTTGYGKPGGYKIPDPTKKKEVKRAKRLQGVGCESCHGPGVEYNKLWKEIFKSKREYTFEEVAALGLIKPDEKNCISCHNEKSPTYDKSKPFDYKAELKKKDQVHVHVPLKQRKK